MSYPAAWENMRDEIARVNDEIPAAEERIRPHIRTTYVEPSPELVRRSGAAEVYLKLENLQITGSFKARGSLSKILSLNAEQARRGIVTASTGNHGLGVANALRLSGCQGVIYLPREVPESKRRALLRLGAKLEVWGDDPVETEAYARRLAEEEGKVYISAYNDYQVIGGQGTLGLELFQQLPEVDTVLVSVGGGGLISGIGAYLKTRRPDVRIIGCLPEKSQVMYQCIRAGRIISYPSYPTLSDGTAGGVEEGSVTFELCRSLIDDYRLVGEQEILSAMGFILREHRQIIEGAAGVAVAPLLQPDGAFAGKRVAVVICGGNVDLSTVRRALECGGLEAVAELRRRRP